jgi:hypothetical protein
MCTTVGLTAGESYQSENRVNSRRLAGRLIGGKGGVQAAAQALDQGPPARPMEAVHLEAAHFLKSERCPIAAECLAHASTVRL